ncbi:MAG: sigma-54 dependent transcriptional regulator [gamma proteobacterium symbiont of Bathyaustriella thionipta]|nr:sigma-54 dependent transcriptional regulator [gamma proteobacterium symbiont of Bathyaustriella thionipta]MCU7949015.1 sigma-54 dependent transcriptional regulator [gamma proteobacterium symbiont of Bathyaustriella thionipta]MCU7952215.1 sigma-54 dependent transcriptional regulator [gamma proteobacterium symbiont of Bathyaustriella thionipta]MCU7955599.1 sigma-54 dependent transcriptional regulator [gamma proteobacterium symbiont of Bathyaustriella thionipta]MCU7967159.1 sigma-54 dependent t
MRSRFDIKATNLPSLLIIDDEPIAIKNLTHLFTKEGYQVTARSTGSGGFKALEEHKFDVVITDLKMDIVDGMGILKKAQTIDPDMPVIMLTGHGSYDSVVQAMKMGAYHYLTKPYQLNEVREIVKNALELVTLKHENKKLKSHIGEAHIGPQIITQDPVTLRLLDTMKQIAPSTCSVIITGESGTGKELAARYIHANSQRNTKPFIAINCGALQEELLANELFGHEKGAFTGAHNSHQGLIETANRGTLFLDEIAEMSLNMQVKLLRVLQENEVQRLGGTKTYGINVRFFSATNRNLELEVAEGRFRQDLFYRLNVIQIHLPPLSERKGDIPLLAYHFLKKHTKTMDKEIEDFDPEVMDSLNQYGFPGNIRELENIVERAIVLSTEKKITPAQLPSSLTEHSVSVMRFNKNKLPTLDEQEIEYIKWVLDKCGGNRTKAAAILGIDRVSLWRKIKKYDIN